MMWALIVIGCVIYFGSGLAIASLVATKDPKPNRLWVVALVPGWLVVWLVGTVIAASGFGHETPFCAYCRRKFPKNEAGKEEVAAHILTCESHPLASARAEVERLTYERDELLAACVRAAFLLDDGFPIKQGDCTHMVIRAALAKVREEAPASSSA